MITHSDGVCKKAEASKNGPISTQPIATPPGPPLPIHNNGKNGDGDTVVVMAQAMDCKCEGEGLARKCKDDKTGNPCRPA